MRYVILGSGGAIGTSLAKALESEETVETVLASRRPKGVTGKETLIAADLLDAAAIDGVCQGADVVFLVAGLRYDTKDWQAQWPVVMKNTIDACASHRSKLIFFDNVYMYGRVDGEMREETPMAPCSAKGEVRAEVAQMLLDAISQKRVDALIARSADFYGPDAPKTFSEPMIFEPLQKGSAAMWMLNAELPHSLTFTPDAARALLVLARDDASWNQVWHLPTAQAVTGREFIRLAAEGYGVEPKIRVLPKWMLTLMGWFSPMIGENNEMLYQFAFPYRFDSSKFESRYFRATPYEEGIQQTITIRSTNV